MGNRVVFAMLLPIILIAIIHLIGFIIAFKQKTDHYTDVIYAFSFLLSALILTVNHPSPGVLHWALLGMVALWAIRLGIFLGYRIRLWGRDRRFDEMRKKWTSLLRFWVLQYTSILIISLPYMIVMTKPSIPISVIQIIGILLFLIGFILESVADYQKFMFKLKPESQGQFMRSGVWKFSRHPNYLGEWIVWVGIFLCCFPYLEGIEWLAIISPIWMFILLRFISGGNLLENSAEKKYGDDPEYQIYKARTGVFFPKVFS